MIKFALFAFLFQFSLIKCEYTRLHWSLCHDDATQTPAFDSLDIDIVPMVIWLNNIFNLFSFLIVILAYSSPWFT